MSSSSNKKNINIKYLAKVAGVSPSTVSRALRGDPTANKNTSERILKIAKDLNYFPNLLAKGLRVKKSKTIGIILNDLKNPYYYETLKVIEDKVNSLDYTMILSDSNYDLYLEKKNIFTMLSKGVDGLIISPVNIDSENIEIIRERDLKTVFIDFAPEYDDLNYVHISHEQASFKATEYLIKKGHRSILLLNGPFQLSVSKDFLNGHIRALNTNGINYQKSLIKHSNLSLEDGYEVTKKMYELKKLGRIDFSAVSTLSDMLAIGVFEASKELGFNIPDDLSVIGCDNIFMTAYLNPPLTTIHVPKIKIGELSAKILFDQIENDSSEFQKIIVDVRLVERDSVKEKTSSFLA